MKIVFLCGSLEPDRDGVGDYTRALAVKLIQQGIVAAGVALNDKFLSENLEESQKINGVCFPVLRISSNSPQRKRFAMAQIWINDIKPDWISLQFVPFSFHPKGLPLGFISAVKNLIQNVNFHIMFHELWIGTNGNESFKMRLLGVLQKVLIKTLISKVKPECITTSIPLYKKNLSESRVRILPLFGNIPIFPFTNYSDTANENFKIVHFGSFTGSIGEFETQLQFLKKSMHFHKREIEFIAFGEGGVYKSKALSLAKTIFGADRVFDKGRVSTKEASILLQTADIGISRANFTTAGKSGTTVAMLEHGLPVLLRGPNRKELNIKSGFEQFKVNLLFPNDEIDLPAKEMPQSFLPTISILFLEILDGNKK